MLKVRYLVSVVVLTASTQAIAAVSCHELLVMPSEQQHAYVRGLVDGMGTTFGVTDTVKKHLKEAANSPGESAGIDKMHDAPRSFMSKGCCPSSEVMTEKIIKGCKARPDLPAGNMLTDVMRGKL